MNGEKVKTRGRLLWSSLVAKWLGYWAFTAVAQVQSLVRETNQTSDRLRLLHQYLNNTIEVNHYCLSYCGSADKYS